MMRNSFAGPYPVHFRFADNPASRVTSTEKMCPQYQPGPLAHGDREMRIWGPIFHEVESDQDWGEVRLDAITKYMESIQQK